MLKRRSRRAKKAEARFNTTIKEKLEVETNLKTTIISLKLVHTEELKRREVEFRNELESYKVLAERKLERAKLEYQEEIVRQ